MFVYGRMAMFHDGNQNMRIGNKGLKETKPHRTVKIAFPALLKAVNGQRSHGLICE